MRFGKDTTMARKSTAKAVESDNSVKIQSLSPVFEQYTDAIMVRKVANAIMIEVRRAAEERLAQLGAPSTTPAKEAIKVPITGTKKGAGAKASAKTAKTAKATTTTKTKAKAEEDIEVDITDKKAMKALGLHFLPYKEKCHLILGNTKPIRKALKEMEGVFPGRFLQPTGEFEGGFAWLANNKDIRTVAKVLGIKAPKLPKAK